MNKYLEKIAKDVEAKKEKPKKKEGDGLKKHQSRSVDTLMNNKGVLLHHSTGSGKTKTILESLRRIQEQNKDSKQLIITPASLTTNIEKERLKHKMKLNMKNVEVISYEKAVNDVARLRKNKYSLVALDEGHKLRNTDTKRFKELEDIVTRADHRLVATATPQFNGAHNMAPLINMVAGKEVMPTSKRDFENKYVGTVVKRPGLVAQFLLGKRPEERTVLKNKKELKDILTKYVDYYNVEEDPEAQQHFPKENAKTFEVPMSSNQERMYKYMEGQMPWIIRMKIRNNLPLDKKESAALNAFSTGVRQVSNSTSPYLKGGGAELSPKLEMAIQELEKKRKGDKNFRGLVYSNYLKAGLDEYSAELNKRKIPHTLYHGGMNRNEKDKAVADYNSGKTPLLLVSSSGSEGLDLKGTKLTQILEPHFNDSKIKQVKGRGGRFNSHSHLPEGERNMEVQHFLSTFKPGLLGPKKSKTIDQYLKENSLNKDQVTEKIKALMKQDDLQ